MEHAVEVPPPPPRGSFGALVRAYRNRAFLSQEQLAERAELSERTVRNLEAQRVRSPRPDTVRLLADALELSGPERAGWFAAAAEWTIGGQAGPALEARAGRPGLGAGSGGGGGLSNADRRELAELRHENRRLREDLQILKRAAAIFDGIAG